MKKVLIYGFGANFIEYEAFIRERYEIIGFIDSGVTKQKTKYCGLSIQSPDEICRYVYDFILITPNPYSEIKSTLLSKGIQEDKILILHKLLVSTEVSKNAIDICFSIGSGNGLGDVIIALNYVYIWAKKYKTNTCKIRVICDSFGDLVRSFTGTENYIDEFVITDNYKEYVNASDLFISVRRYPKVIKSSDYLISVLAPEILDYLLLIRKFYICHPDLVGIELLADGKSVVYEKSVGHKRISQADIFDDLRMSEKFEIDTDIDSSLLDRLGLKEKKYITIHRGCDRNLFNSSNVKLWNEENYEELIKLLKEKYQDVEIVLLGDEYERSDKIISADLDLLGKTDFEDLKGLLKHSLLHIDTEGGLVHLRHAVKGGPSVVLFGPTDPDFFGYSENVNIRTDACPVPCEWKTLDWVTNCHNGSDKNCCMASITPQMVFEAVKDIMLTKVYKSI